MSITVHNIDWDFPIPIAHDISRESFRIANKICLFFEIHSSLKRVKAEGNVQGCEPLVALVRFDKLNADEDLHVRVQTSGSDKGLPFSTGFLKPSAQFIPCSDSITRPLKSVLGKLKVEVFIWSGTGSISADAPKKVESIDWSSDKITDFTFDVDGVHFKVHKAVCIGRSSEFRNVFIGSVDNTAIISDISKGDFKEFLHFIYTSSQEFTNVLNMLSIARKYKVKGLVKACANRLLANLSDAIAEEAFFAAHEFGCDDGLKKAAFKLIQERFTKISCILPDSLVGKPKAVKDAIEKKKALVEMKKAVDDSEKATAELKKAYETSKKALEQAFIAEDKAEDHNYAKC